MHPSNLHVITAISNPIGWVSRIKLYRDFEQHMVDSGVHLYVPECAYGDNDWVLNKDLPQNVHHIPLRAKTRVWNKENLINIAISRLPDNWKYVAWIDGDITFRTQNWAEKTLHELQHYDVIQPWSDCYDLGPNGEHIQHHKSFCHQFYHGHKIGHGPYTFAHPGYAWAATRHALESVGGLLETGSLGAGDHHMALALLGRANESVPGKIHPNYLQMVKVWEKRAMQHISKNIGYIKGTIEHAFHGSKENRGYISRWDILTKHQFDPIVDVKRNTHGVVELCGNKPELKRDIDRYFKQRNEDSNCI